MTEKDSQATQNGAKIYAQSVAPVIKGRTHGKSVLRSMRSHAIQQNMQRRCCPPVTCSRSLQRLPQPGARSRRLQQTQHAGHRARDGNTAALLPPAPRSERFKVVNIRRLCAIDREIQLGMLHGVLTAHKGVKAQHTIGNNTAGVQLKRGYCRGTVASRLGATRLSAAGERRGWVQGLLHADAQRHSASASEKKKACKGIGQAMETCEQKRQTRAKVSSTPNGGTTRALHGSTSGA